MSEELKPELKDRLWGAVNYLIKHQGGKEVDKYRQLVDVVAQHVEKTVADIILEANRPPTEFTGRWVARVQHTPFNFTTPERLVVEANTESEARQTLEANGYTTDFQWHIRELKPEVKAIGKLVGQIGVDVLSGQ